MALRKIGSDVILDSQSASAQNPEQSTQSLPAGVRKLSPDEHITLDSERGQMPARYESPVFFPKKEKSSDLDRLTTYGGYDALRRLYEFSGNVSDYAADKVNQAEYGLQKVYYDTFGYPEQAQNVPAELSVPQENMISSGLRESANRDFQSANVLAGREIAENAEPSVTWEQVKQNPISLDTTPRFILEQGAISAPEMATAMIPGVGLPLVTATTTQNVLENRAAVTGRNPRDVPDDQSMKMAVSAGLVSAQLERLGILGDVPWTLGGRAKPVSRYLDIPAGMVKSGIGETVTEIPQEITELYGSTSGTGHNPTLQEVIDTGASAGLVGFGMGAGVRGSSETLSAVTRGFPERTTDSVVFVDQPAATRDDLADAIKNPAPENRTNQDTNPPEDQPQKPTPAAQALNTGDRVRHTNRFGETVVGTVDTVSDVGGERTVSVIDGDGVFHTLFENEGAIERLPTRDDLANIISGGREDGDNTITMPTQPTEPVQEQIQVQQPVTPQSIEEVNTEPQPTQAVQDISYADMSDEQLSTSLNTVMAQGKQQGWNKFLRQTREDIKAEIATRTVRSEAEQAVQQEADAVNTEPTEAQKEAGNYQKGHISVSGLPITIENPKGSTRSGKDSDGEVWNVEMPAHYGYFKRTEGADGDQLDTYIGDNLEADKVFVIDQIDAKSKEFDEHKAFVGFNSLEEVADVYDRSFSDGRSRDRLGAVKEMSVDEFKVWVKDGDQSKPLLYGKDFEGEEKIMPTSIEDSRGGELFGSKQITVGGTAVSSISLSIYQNDVWIKDIITRPGQRRKGYAKKLVDALFDEYPNDRIVVSGMTEDGAAFFKQHYNISDDGVLTKKQSGKPKQPEVAPEQAENTEETRQTDSEPEQNQAPEQETGNKKGEVGMKLAEGEQVLTTTGRLTTPFPKINTKTNRTTELTVKRVDQWLMQNAIDEAKARGDDFNLRQFEAAYKKPSQADKDSAEAYLFDPDFVFENPPSILKPLSTPETKQKWDGLEENVLAAVTNQLVDAQYTEDGKTRVYLTDDEINTLRKFGYKIEDNGVMPWETSQELLDERTRFSNWRKSNKQKTTQPETAPEPAENIETKSNSVSEEANSPTASSSEVETTVKAEEAKQDAEAPSVPDGFAVDEETMRKLRPDEKITNPGEWTVVARRISPFSSARGYGNTQEEARQNALLRVGAFEGETRTEDIDGDDNKDQRSDRHQDAEKQEQFTQTEEKSDRGKRLEDVGEKMEGKRAFQDGMKDKSVSAQARQIISATKPKEAFKIERGENQSTGLARYAQELVDELRNFSEVLKRKRILSAGGRSRWSVKVPGWEEQVKIIFSENPELTQRGNIKLGDSSLTETEVREKRLEIIEAAENYIEFSSRISQMFAQSETVADFKKKLMDAMESDKDFLKAFKEDYSKAYSLYKNIFSDSEYSRFGSIKDDTKEKESKRVEKTLSRPKSESFERPGLQDYRQGKDISPDDFMNTFGFRGVEFGEWVNASEGQAHVNHAFEALHDLANRLGIDPKHISLGGKLGFAFGSRGSGEHAAHYEPNTNVINLTKTKGDGSVAHEWLHALDYNLRANDSRSKQLMELAYKSLQVKINDVEKYQSRIKNFLKGELWYQNSKKDGPIGNARRDINIMSKNVLKYFSEPTEFQKNADSLGKNYWGLGREVIARAWESFIYDTLEGKSPYLVNDWVAEGAVKKETGYRGTPFPEGDERQRFNQFFEEFLKTLEFTENGVKFKDGVKLPIEIEAEKAKEGLLAYLPKLADMMEEINNAGSVQRADIQAGVSKGDGRESADSVPGGDQEQNDQGDRDRGRGTGPTSVSGDGREITESGEDGRRSEAHSDRDRVQRDDTVLEPDENETPAYTAKGTNHVIAVGALDEKRGQKQKAKDNLEIIRLVKEIEKENRPATPEEQEKLARYTGWGSVKNAFPDGTGQFKEEWADLGKQVKDELTDQEYREARRSIQYAHYTSEIVVRSMWDALERFGLSKGSVFEPGMGIGHFAGMMPQTLKTKYSGLEMDSMTTRIARILYPQSSIRKASFVDARYADNMFDAVIGNPPFQAKGSGIKYKNENVSLHNFFFLKSLDMVAPGGVVAFVTSRFSMDTLDSVSRKMMAEQADLIGAIRLPDTAFKTNAHTEVVTDIIFLRKRLPGEESNGIKWIETKDSPIQKENGDYHQINEYFADNPEMVLGDYGYGTMYGSDSLTVTPAENSDLKQQIEEAINRLPEGVITEIQKEKKIEMDFTPEENKEGSYYIKDGILMQVDQGVGLPVPLRGKGKGGITKNDEKKIRALIPVRNALRKTMAAMLKRDEASMKDAQKELRKHYDAFFKKYGPITKSETVSRPATPSQHEDARSEMRNDFMAADQEFNEGDIDLTHLIGKINPETGKKFTSAQIAKIRQNRKESIEAAGGIVDEGDFDPSMVPDNVNVNYPNLKVFQQDPESYNLMILDTYNEEDNTSKTTDVFEKNIIAEVKKPEIKTAVDALNYSLIVKNDVNVDFMAQELGRNREALIEELKELDLIYGVPDPNGGEDIYIYSEEYLSGHVKDKLAYARILAERNSVYQRNVLALEAVQPKDIPVYDINTQFGSPYFEPEAISDFMKSELNIPVSVKYVPVLSSWEVEAHDQYAPENTSQHGTKERPASVLLQHLLNRKDIKVEAPHPTDEKKRVVDVEKTQAAQDKAKELQEKFSNWIWKSEHAEGTHKRYNDKYNNTVPRVPDGSHLTTAISPTITLRPHQKNAVWRVLQMGNSYFAHAVGAGKTLEMVVSGMEMRRLGLWKKPMYVVPNHMLAQFAGEFKAAYPQAKIFVADENNFHTDRRKRFVANVAKSDWDAVIMTYSSFKKVPISKTFEAEMIEKELDRYRVALQEAGVGRGQKAKRGTTAARIEKQIEKMENRLQSLKVKDKDESFAFEELGIDSILLDEAHYFRKLSFATQQGNMKGVNPVGSKAAWDLYIKSKYLDTINPGRNLVMASGTPLTNTLAEVYTIQRFMNERALIERGIETFDAWSSVYAATVTNPERQPSGAYKTVTRLAEFRNLATLSAMVREFMDTVTSDELGALVDRPALKTGSMIIKTTPPTTTYLAFQKYLEQRTKDIAKSTRKNVKGADNILAVINEGRHAAIDMRTIDPSLPEERSKLEDMIENIFDVWKKTSEDSFKNKYRGDDRISAVKGGAQLVFSDLGVQEKTKNGKNFSVYDHIRRKLIRNGVPERQIAFISDYDGFEEKRRLSNLVNSGEVRILIGSTSKMGTGLNVQNRLKAVHNLDAPWLPADLEQRGGRALRQGNQYGEIEIYGYGTEGSYDSTMWGMLETKAKAIIQFLKGGSDLSTMRDIEETDHYRIAKAMTSGDPRVLKQAELQSEVDKLSRQSKNFYNEQVQIKSDMARKKSYIESNKDLISQINDLQKRLVVPPEGEFSMTVRGKPYTDRAEAAKALHEAVLAIAATERETSPDGVKIGEYYGLDLHYFMALSNVFEKRHEIFLKDPALSREGKEWAGNDNFSPSGAITTLTNSINRLDKRRDEAGNMIERFNREIKVLESNISGEFQKQAELESKIQQLAEIERDLQANAPVEVTYDEYPIDYWRQNKEEMSAAFSLLSDEEYRLYFKGSLKAGQQNADVIAKDIEKALKKLSFPKANVNFFDPEKGVQGHNFDIDNSVQGYYYKGLIYISMTAQDAVATLNHEVIHALRKANAFLDGEWKSLLQKAPEWRKRYNIDKTYEDVYRKLIADSGVDASRASILLEEKLNEEAIARAFQDYNQKGLLQRLRNKVARFFATIRNVLTGKGYKTYQQVFDDVGSGKVSRRSNIEEKLTGITNKNLTIEELSDALSDKYGMSVAMGRNKDGIVISAFKVQEGERGLGTGKKAMREIMNYADANMETLYITPTKDVGFYKKLGFTNNLNGSESLVYHPDINVRYSILPKGKSEALDKARSELEAIHGIDRELRPSISKVASLILHPHQIASLYEKFTPVYQGAINMFKFRDVLISKLSSDTKLYGRMSQSAKSKINAVLEIGRLSGETYEAENGKITVKNKSHPNTVHSKIGETITLEGPSVTAYLGVRKAMNNALNTYIDIVIEEFELGAGIKNSSDLSKALASETDEKEIGRMREALKIILDIEHARKSGYVPFKRWGEIGITVREISEEETLVHFERVELPRVPGRKKKIIGDNKEVQEAVRRLTQKYPADKYSVETFQIKDFTNVSSNLNLNELDVLAMSTDMSAEDYEAMREMLSDALQRRGFRSHFYKAGDVPGYSSDFERAINDYIVSISGHLARRKHMKKLDKAVQKIAESGQTSLFEYARDYVSYVTNPREEFSGVRQMAFFWYLAGNIASGVTNAMQPMMVTAPWFKGMFSHAEIAAQMSAAYKDAMLMIKPGLDVFDFDKAPQDVRMAMKKAAAEGDFIPLETWDAMGGSRRHSTHIKALGRAARTASETISLTFSVPERMNRVVTYMAAYRFAIRPENKVKIYKFIGGDQLARSSLNGKSGQDFAAAFADYAVFSTQYRMGKLNRPKLGRNAGTLMFQFISFTTQSLELMYRLSRVHGGKKGQALGMMLFAVVAMAGFRGIPFEEDLEDFFEFMWKRVNRTDLDIETEIRKKMTEIFGKTFTVMIMNGAPSAFLNVDMSTRLGFGNIWPDDQPDLLGVWYDMLYTKPFENAFPQLARGDVTQAAATISPAFIRNMLQSFLWATQGVQSSSTGDTIIPPENLNDLDIALKFFGFTSADVSEERSRVYAEQRLSRAANDLRSDYYDRLARAYAAKLRAFRAGDKGLGEDYISQIKAIQDEIDEYNSRSPDYLKIILNQRALKQRVLEELKGAVVNKPRKQARKEAAKLRDAYGRQ